MAVSTTDTISGPYSANGVTVAFPFTFKAVSVDDVGVLVRDAGGDDIVVSPSAYTVTLSAEGGTVLMETAPASGNVYIFSEPSFLQPVTFATGQAFLPSVVNEVNDRDVVRALYLKREIDRAPKTPLGGGAEGKFAVVNAGGGWDFSSGTGNDPALRTDLADPAIGADLIADNPRRVPADHSLGRRFTRTLPLNGGDYNADPGKLDNSDAITSWLLDGGAGTTLVCTPGDLRFASPISIPARDKLTVEGAGRFQTRLLYTGVDRTADILTIGTPGQPMQGHIKGFNVDRFSAQSMLDGFAITLIEWRGGYTVEDVCPGNSGAAALIHGGIAFRNCNVGSYRLFEFRPGATGIEVTGAAGGDSGSDLSLGGGLLLGGVDQIHVGGGFGGLYVGDVICYGGERNVLIDQGVVDRGNREIILTDACCLDAGNAAHIRVNQAGGNLFLQTSAWLSGAGFFTANPGIGIDIEQAPYSVVEAHGMIKNTANPGIRYNDPTCSLSGTAMIAYAGGDGIHSTVQTENIDTSRFRFLSVAGQRINGLARSGRSAALAINVSSGAIGSANGSVRYRIEGNLVRYTVQISIVTNGTAAGLLSTILPFQFKERAVATGVDDQGVGAHAFAAAGTGSNSELIIARYDGTYAGGTGRMITLMGEGEIYG